MKRRMHAWKAAALAGLMSVYLLGGCTAAEEFRTVAGDSLHAGITTIATGIIDGIFAVFEPDGV